MAARAVTVKLPLAPVARVWLEGWTEMLGATPTESVAAVEVAFGAAQPTTVTW